MNIIDGVEPGPGGRRGGKEFRGGKKKRQQYPNGLFKAISRATPSKRGNQGPVGEKGNWFQK